MPAAEQWAQQLCEIPPIAVRAAKEAMMKGIDMTLEEGLRYEGKLMDVCTATEDHAEARRHSWTRERRTLREVVAPLTGAAGVLTVVLPGHEALACLSSADPPRVGGRWGVSGNKLLPAIASRISASAGIHTRGVLRVKPSAYSKPQSAKGDVSGGSKMRLRSNAEPRS